MPVTTTDKLIKLNRELVNRFQILREKLVLRPLHTSKEGCKNRTHWVNPDSMSATVGTASELRVAADDFKTILTEIKRLK